MLQKCKQETTIKHNKISRIKINNCRSNTQKSLNIGLEYSDEMFLPVGTLQLLYFNIKHTLLNKVVKTKALKLTGINPSRS